MIIWGSKVREVTESSGEFNCPECSEKKAYALVKAKKFFTLYFIPLFPTETLGSYIKCQSCQKYFKEAVLQYSPPTEEDRLVHSVAQDLNSGTPIQMVRRKLLNLGMAESSVNQVLDRTVGSAHKTCTPCQLDFLANVKACSGCGVSL